MRIGAKALASQLKNKDLFLDTKIQVYQIKKTFSHE